MQLDLSISDNVVATLSEYEFSDKAWVVSGRKETQKIYAKQEERRIGR